MHSAAKIVRAKIKAHTAESRKAADQRKSREALRKAMVFRARQPWRNVALARTLLPNRSAHLETDGRPRINRQGHDSQPVPESAVAAAFRRREFVPMMEPTNFGDRDDPPGFWRLDGA